MKYKECEQCGERLTLIVLSSNIILAVLKFIVGVCSQSFGCIADSLHSLANTVNIIGMMISHKIEKKQIDDNYHYGYGKIEFVAAAFITILIISAASFVFIVSISSVLTGKAMKITTFSALIIPIAAIAANAILFKYMKCVGLQLKNQKTISFELVNKTDYLSSGIVFIGVFLSKIGFIYFDSIAAIAVTIVVIKTCISIIKESINGLMDSSLNASYTKGITRIASGIEGVSAIAGLKTRQVGQKIWADIDICIDNRKTILDANILAEKLKEAILNEMIDFERVIVNCIPIT